MTTGDFAIKAMLAAVILGSIGGVASQQFTSEPATATESVEAEPWRPTRNTIGKEQPLSAEALDRLHPSDGAALRASHTVKAPAKTRASWSFRGCREARAAGMTPLFRGQPGYSAHMDGDGDGIACENYKR